MIDEEHPEIRTAKALEFIGKALEHMAGSLEKMANPPLMVRGKIGDKEVTFCEPYQRGMTD